MAQPVPPPRRDRSRSRSRHSYEGFVEKRGPRDQVGPGTEPRHPPGPSPGLPEGLGRAAGAHARLLRGTPGLRGGPTLGCPQPLEMLDLGELVAVRTEGGGLVLRLRGQEVTLKAESWEAQEMWRGFILTMAEMKVPTDLALLPGHLFQLSEALRDERDRRATPRVPSCFFEVTRPEAERLLERSADGGNMVLRPGGHGRGVSVTTRREVNGTVQVKHYKVNRVDQGYVIDVDTPHRCSSLAEVVQYFVESSKGSLQPLHREYSPRLGERDPQSSAPHPAPRRALQPPHNHDVAEELAKKLQLRRALTGD
ncbi:signal-transducing adaptor protein 2 isoform X2 [Aquila chrysaetos chrysaetos]|uniref:signal-transducing adaptor protein 2 isoform X2 n=1 Tax=Aquila chrysaetos chrysaetos TaxID=223781 RepID=UPI001176A99E|nr:signal-transducing adaptor protein 2 isoform X2 [Aquila chrysaetos chrysaetos]